MLTFVPCQGVRSQVNGGAGSSWATRDPRGSLMASRRLSKNAWVVSGSALSIVGQLLATAMVSPRFGTGPKRTRRYGGAASTLVHELIPMVHGILASAAAVGVPNRFGNDQEQEFHRLESERPPGLQTAVTGLTRHCHFDLVLSPDVTLHGTCRGGASCVSSSRVGSLLFLARRLETSNHSRASAGRGSG